MSHELVCEGDDNDFFKDSAKGIELISQFKVEEFMQEGLQEWAVGRVQFHCLVIEVRDAR